MTFKASTKNDGPGIIDQFHHELPSGSVIVEHTHTNLPDVTQLLAYQDEPQPAEVKAVPTSILIQPNALSGDGIKPTTYSRCDVISLYLVRADNSREWLTDISKTGAPGADYSKIHTTAARYSMEHSVYIQPFDIALLK